MSKTTAADLALKIINVLRAQGHTAVLVGGCVRDHLLRKIPKDFDVATTARPDQILDLFPKAEGVGAHFGVILVCEEGVCVEVATFRSDYSYRDGRRPDRVVFETDPKQDALRRDFTINALMIDPVSNQVLDFVGGQADLDRAIIRAIGDPETRFQEDRLRMLRAVRFAARLGFSIEPATMAAIQRLRKLIHTVSAERIRDEIARILTEGGARRGFELLDESGLLAEILPEVAAMKGVEQPPEFHPEGDVWIHTLMMLERLENPSLALALGVLLHDVGKPPTFRVADRIRFDEHEQVGARMASEILERLRFSSDTIERVRALVANHMKFKDLQKMRDSTLKRFLRQDHFDEHLDLHRVDCLSSHGYLDAYEFARDRLAAMPEEELRPPRLITGDDLIAEGYRPGPQFSQMLSMIEDAQLEGCVHSHEEALRLVRESFGPPDDK